MNTKHDKTEDGRQSRDTSLQQIKLFF